MRKEYDFSKAIQGAFVQPKEDSNYDLSRQRRYREISFSVELGRSWLPDLMMNEAPQGYLGKAVGPLTPRLSEGSCTGIAKRLDRLPGVVADGPVCHGLCSTARHPARG